MSMRIYLEVLSSFEFIITTSTSHRHSEKQRATGRASDIYLVLQQLYLARSLLCLITAAVHTLRTGTAALMGDCTAAVTVGRTAALMGDCTAAVTVGCTAASSSEPACATYLQSSHRIILASWPSNHTSLHTGHDLRAFNLSHTTNQLTNCKSQSQTAEIL